MKSKKAVKKQKVSEKDRNAHASKNLGHCSATTTLEAYAHLFARRHKSSS
jgi:hypothetical protein